MQRSRTVIFIRNMDQAIKHLSRKKFAISSTWSIFHEALNEPLNEPLKFIVLSFKATLSQTFLNFKVFKKKTLSTQFHDHRQTRWCRFN